MLEIEPLGIDTEWVGFRWTTSDLAALSRVVASVAMGQVSWAAHVVATLDPAAPPISDADLLEEAKIRLTVGTVTGGHRSGYPRHQRDGFVFEVICWAAARLSHGDEALLKDPHTSATTQGLDGLMLLLTNDGTSIDRTTIFEDKCTENPRSTFLNQVLPAFVERHRNQRSAEIIAVASALLKSAGMTDLQASRAAGRVMDLSRRHYQAAFAVSFVEDSDEERIKLFKDFESVQNIQRTQRLGVTFVAGSSIRTWFEQISTQAIAYLDGL